MVQIAPVNVGDILGGKYQVERVLGVGGMGVVVSARHLALGERVAIKFLLPEALAREDVVKRFIQEGRASNRLRGEHVARVHDVGRLETGAPFLVMEYLDGRDLGAVLREQGPLSVETAVDYLLQACEALAEAHSAHIIHRDLKPSNLFLTRRLDGSPSIKLIDFGISKMLFPSTDGIEGERTATSMTMGSPLYMAPEQMASTRDVDLRADIWSLGILLHTMLTGSPPFRAPTMMALYELIVQGPPPIRAQRADVPEGIEAAILKCLQRDRLHRYASVGELASAIAPFGPAEARFTADRIQRILVARSTKDGFAPSSTEVLVPVEGLTSALTTVRPDPVASTGPAPGISIPASAPPPSGASPAIDPLGTHGPWDQKTAPPLQRVRPMALIAAVAAVLVGAPLAFLALRASYGPALTPSVDSADARQASPDGPASGPKSRAPAEPTVALVASTSPAPPADPGQPSLPPSISVAPSTAPSAPARPTAEAAATGRSHRVPPPPRVPARVKSPDDLFGTQK
jgi:serine/threonine-protein kinase